MRRIPLIVQPCKTGSDSRTSVHLELFVTSCIAVQGDWCIDKQQSSQLTQLLIAGVAHFTSFLHVRNISLLSTTVCAHNLYKINAN